MSARRQERRQKARARRRFRSATRGLLGSHQRNAETDRGPLERSLWSLAVDVRESMRLREPVDEAALLKLFTDLTAAILRAERRKMEFDAALHGIVRVSWGGARASW
jgi:hypothetical protein